MKPPVLEGHARALNQVHEQNGGAPFDLRITLRKGAYEDICEEARAVLLHELSLEPSAEEVDAAAEAAYEQYHSPEKWRRALDWRKDVWRTVARAALKAARAKRKETLG